MKVSAGPRVSWSQIQLIKLILSARKNKDAADCAQGPWAPWAAEESLCCCYLVHQGWETIRDLGPQPGRRCDCLTFHRVGEGRACWSLGNAYVSMGSPAQALTFAKKHLQISQEVSWAHSPRPLLVPQQPVISFWGTPLAFLNVGSLNEQWPHVCTGISGSMEKQGSVSHPWSAGVPCVGDSVGLWGCWE